MCWKYINPHGTVFIYCEIANEKEQRCNYLRCFTDGIDDYESHYNYCPYCGSELRERER